MQMNNEMKIILKEVVTKHEGRKKRAYIDTENNITGGIGHNLSAHDFSDKIIDDWYEEDSEFFYKQLNDTFQWFQYLNQARQIGLIDLAFMGFKSFLSFRKLIAALRVSDFDWAANEILSSKYAKQVGQRAIDIANIIRTGVIV